MKSIGNTLNFKLFENKWLYLFLMYFISIHLYSQEIKKYEDFIAGNKIYRPYANYVTLATGYNYNFGLKHFEQNASIAYHFRIKDNNFQTGYHISSDEFFLNRSYQMLNDIFFLYGIRRDSSKTNWGAYGGLTYAFGSTYAYSKIDSASGNEIKKYKTLHKIGFYAEAEITRKIFYDFGLGLSLYTSINKSYQVAGLKLHLYFSSAYRGKIE